MHIICDSRGVSKLSVSNWNPYVGIADFWEMLASREPFKHTDYALFPEETDTECFGRLAILPKPHDYNV